MKRKIKPRAGRKSSLFNSLGDTQKKSIVTAVLLLLMFGIFLEGRFAIKHNPGPPGASALSGPNLVPPALKFPYVGRQLLTMINFSGASPSKIQEVLSTYNKKECGCGCSMSVAECLVADPHCPIWKDHANQLQEALGNGKKPDFSKAASAPVRFPIVFPTRVSKAQKQPQKTPTPIAKSLKSHA